MKEASPLVTVVTVTFNLVKSNRIEQFVKCIESVHAQNYPNIEHLIIDGASDDGTLDIINNYQNKGWLVCHSEPDTGIYDAMNKGIKRAKGKYVAFLNSDDLWHNPNGITATVRELEINSATLAYSSRYFINQEGEVILEELAAAGIFIHHMPFCHQTVFTRRDALIRYNGFDTANYKSAADYDLIARMLLNGESAVYVPLCFTSFRFGGYSTEAQDISEREVKQIQRKLMPECPFELIQDATITESYMSFLLSRLHPTVAQDLMRRYTRVGAELYHLTDGRVRYFSSGSREADYNILPSNNQVTTNQEHTIERKRNSYLLFGFIPVLHSTHSASLSCWRIFGLPLISIKHKPSSFRVLLFCCIPLLTGKKTA